MHSRRLLVRHLGQRAYEPVWREMQKFTDIRNPESPNEIWLVEHPPVFTLGQAGRLEHILDPGEIPVIRSDRGGQVTYHGPGQLVAYVLMDLRRTGLGVRRLVTLIEKSVIELLAEYGVSGQARPDAPGVYVAGKKIASLGLRVRHGCSFHGVSLNVNMDLSPFYRINPCGYPGLEVTQLAILGASGDLRRVGGDLVRYLAANLGYAAADLEETDRPYEQNG